MKNILLGVNIDHVATIRNARGTDYPQPFDVIALAQAGGADGITIHLREDRRHIIDADVEKICMAKPLPINLEMAATSEMLEIALKNKPHEVCLVPEKREELTTEGGLDVLLQKASLTDYIARLQQGGILVSLFVDPDDAQIQACAEVGADIIELHTGTYAQLTTVDKFTTVDELQKELDRLEQAAQQAHGFGLTVNAGHGLTVDNVAPIAQLPHINCLNIGHAIVARAIFIGIEAAVQEIKKLARYN